MRRPARAPAWEPRLWCGVAASPATEGTRVPMGGDAASRANPTSDELLRAVVESSVEFAIFAVDPSGKVLIWNKGAERLLGYSEAEMVGRDGDIIFSPEDRARHEPERERQVAAASGRAD